MDTNMATSFLNKFFLYQSPELTNDSLYKWDLIHYYYTWIFFIVCKQYYSMCGTCKYDLKKEQ
jgi:hypothetical protein